MIERGLTSVLKEHDPNAPLPPEHPAFLVANTTADEQRLIYNLLVLLRLPQLEPLGSPEFAQAMHKTRKSVIELLDSMADCREIPNHAAKATELYSRYGRTGHLVEGWHA